MASQPQFEGRPSIGPDAANDSVATLLTRLVNDVTGLLRNELTLAKSELGHAATEAKQGAVSMATSGAVMFGGYLALLAAAILGLSNVMSPWLAALIVGVAAMIIGAILWKSGERKVTNTGVRLERTQESLRKDADTVRTSL